MFNMEWYEADQLTVVFAPKFKNFKPKIHMQKFLFHLFIADLKG